MPAVDIVHELEEIQTVFLVIVVAETNQGFKIHVYKPVHGYLTVEKMSESE